MIIYNNKIKIKSLFMKVILGHQNCWNDPRWKSP